ncbi:hypothetical protein MARU1_000042 [Malassezia arunalokei]|uniref:Ricin B lectin domain-containing protein n=1 Tax=Malassezia arunalokei TaxID=1514897 RepID=A0AAJ6CJQ3_9BASI|nr:hypothetical protein MARU1_000042 [Malassezia arunalokei]
MQCTVFLASVLAAFAASASAAPVSPDVSAPISAPAPAPPSEPAPVVEAVPKDEQNINDAASKLVTKLQCTNYTSTGMLKLDDKTVMLKDSDLVLSGGDELTLVFQECKSNILDVESKGTMHYGIISPKGSEKQQCLRPTALAQPDQHLQVQDCSMSDDSSQMSQFFEFNENGKTLAFLGHLDATKHYSANEKDNFFVVSPEGAGQSLVLV